MLKSTLLQQRDERGYLKRLEEDYNVIARTRPIFSKEGSQAVRFVIVDIFLQFWFKYSNPVYAESPINAIDNALS